nr:hypothetical protein [uncultured Halomonas sp.]
MTKETFMTWTVQVTEDATGVVIKTIPVRGEREALKVESAIDAKLDHENYTCHSVPPSAEIAKDQGKRIENQSQ